PGRKLAIPNHDDCDRSRSAAASKLSYRTVTGTDGTATHFFVTGLIRPAGGRKLTASGERSTFKQKDRPKAVSLFNSSAPLRQGESSVDLTSDDRRLIQFQENPASSLPRLRIRERQPRSS